MLKRKADYMLSRERFRAKLQKDLREYCLPQIVGDAEFNGAYLYYRLLAAKAFGNKYWDSLEGRPMVYAERHGKLNADGTITWEE